MTIPAIHRLRQEHRNLRLLLDVLDRQLAHVATGDTPDYSLMHQILGYLVTYPDRYHHSFEDLLFARLVKRSPTLTPAVEALEDEHERMAVEGAVFRRLVGGLLDGQVLRRAELLRAGRGYLSGYRLHMDIEESRIYRKLEQTLTPADWLELLTRFQWTADPLFSRQASAEFHGLRTRIVIEAGGRWPDGAPGRRACPVCSDRSPSGTGSHSR